MSLTCSQYQTTLSKMNHLAVPQFQQSYYERQQLLQMQTMYFLIKLAPQLFFFFCYFILLRYSTILCFIMEDSFEHCFIFSPIIASFYQTFTLLGPFLAHLLSLHLLLLSHLNRAFLLIYPCFPLLPHPLNFLKYQLSFLTFLLTRFLFLPWLLFIEVMMKFQFNLDLYYIFRMNMQTYLFLHYASCVLQINQIFLQDYQLIMNDESYPLCFLNKILLILFLSFIIIFTMKLPVIPDFQSL